MADLAPSARVQADMEYAGRQALYDTAKVSECSVCRRQMDVRTSAGGLVLACPADPTHEGYRKRRSLTRLVKDGYYIPYVSELVERRRQEEMEAQIGNDEATRALVTYGSQDQAMTAPAAKRIIGHLWPNAKSAAVERALLISVQYNLNPLNHDVYIIPFKNKDGTVSEVVVLGIEANRKMARRRTSYSYVDGPRAMTTQEVRDTGEDPEKTIGAICVLQTEGGNRFPGYGFWRRGANVMGDDKGNTAFNMACYRAERSALKRVMPDAELPAPVGMVIDGVFADVTAIGEQPKLQAPAVRPTSPPAKPSEAKPTPRPTADDDNQPGPPDDVSDLFGPEFGGEPAPAQPAARPRLIEADFLALSSLEQEKLISAEMVRIERPAFHEIRAKLGLTKATSGLTPEERLALAKAVVAAPSKDA